MTTLKVDRLNRWVNLDFEIFRWIRLLGFVDGLVIATSFEEVQIEVAFSLFIFQLRQLNHLEQ